MKFSQDEEGGTPPVDADSTNEIAEGGSAVAESADILEPPSKNSSRPPSAEASPAKSALKKSSVISSTTSVPPQPAPTTAATSSPFTKNLVGTGSLVEDQKAREKR